MRRIAVISSLLTCCVLSGGLPAADDKKAAPTAAEKPATPEGIAFFEKKIRPVLVDKCFSCHSVKAEKLRGNLLLDTREGTRKGGDLGAAVVPGNVKESLLIQALHHTEEHLKMPPKQKLSDDVIADFDAWVKMGAPDPRDGGARVVKKEIDIEKGRQFWAFQPPTKAVPPPVKDASWPRSDIDRFILGALDAKNLKPAGDADQRTLLRRVYYDLIGLPPTPEEVENFAKDQSPQAFEKVVDRLLASPQFGERWGRHWLDVARYAESCGKQFNFTYPHAWRYRDYVIAAFNNDKPYDRFVKEQLAGDLMPAAGEKQKAEMQIATGFLAIGPKDLSERIALQFSMDVVDEQIDVSTQAFLGLTVGCARCHDHKFDPIPMKDYYALAGIFRSTTTCYGYGSFLVQQNSNPSSLIRLWPESEQPVVGDSVPPSRLAVMAKDLAELKKQRTELFKDRNNTAVNLLLRNTFQIANVESQLDRYQEDGKPKQQAMGVRERLTMYDSPTYVRGEIDKPGDVAPRGYVQVLSKKPLTIKSGSGRLELAEAIGARENPLTARVMANRVWLHLFGAGIVATPDNFGASGQVPSNQPLLDHLAVAFMDDGWSVKKLIRRIVLSHAYHLSSQHLAKNFEVDPDNTLVWRMAKKRQDAESLRDGILAVSGLLELAPPRASSVARAGEGLNFGGRQQGPFEARDPHRSVYMTVIRNQLPEALALFDFAEASMVIGERPTTTVPAQGLYLLNSQWVIRQAESAADKLLVKPMSEGERIREGYLRFFGRPPSDPERKAAEDFLAKYEKSVVNERAGTGSKRRSSWSALCQAWFASAEFLYIN